MKRILSVIVSLAILAIIYSQLDFDKIKLILLASNVKLIALAAFSTLPLLYLQSIRLTWITNTVASLPLKESYKLVSLGNTLNFVLPSKLGDLSKAYFINKRHDVHRNTSISIIVFEKMLDAIGLVTVSTLGLVGFGFWMQYPILSTLMCGGTVFTLIILYSRKSVHISYYWFQKLCPKFLLKFIKPIIFNWFRIQGKLQKDSFKITKLIILTFSISFGHFVQLWIMYRSIAPTFPLSVHLALSPITIAAGLLPLAFSGVGTRDAAIVLAFSTYMRPETSASFGILATVRMLFLAIPGLLFLGTYFRNKSEIKK